jgi:hypothetical protein
MIQQTHYYHKYSSFSLVLYIYCTYFYITGVEKNNDDVRTYHLTKSNKWDAPRDILLASKRLQVTGEQARKRRGYQKANNDNDTLFPIMEIISEPVKKLTRNSKRF